MWMLWRLQRRSVELRRLCMQPVSPFQEGLYILPFGQVIYCVVLVIVWFDEFLVLFCPSAPLIMHGKSLWKDIGTIWAPRFVFVTRTGLVSSLYLSSLHVVVIVRTYVLFSTWILDLELTVRCDVQTCMEIYYDSSRVGSEWTPIIPELAPWISWVCLKVLTTSGWQ